ncbi:MAG: hypothetical protein OHK0019_16020 [Saprospiraceae bacterium]
MKKSFAKNARFKKSLKPKKDFSPRKMFMQQSHAMGENLFSRFKAELLEKGDFDGFDDAYTEIFEYIELCYTTTENADSFFRYTPRDR